ncbi:hypothetical protein [Sciscionella sediminilitoris]|uniref:hypothetical protein n=1 Tax=Sciscionella sediminilitoris TaxID=1445613 RepID=UPI0012E0ED64|nr:hypothetical protein [Sciscionella sp. SE31]
MTDKEPGSEFGPEFGSAPYPAGQPPAAQQPPTEAELAAFRQWKAWQEQQYPPQQAPPPVPYDPGYPAPLPPQGQGGQFTGQQPGQPGVQAELALVREQLTALQQSQERVERATNPPLWKRILRSAPVRWVVGLIVVIAIASWAIDHYFGGGGEEDSPQAKFPLARPQQQVKVGVDSPKDAVAELYREVGMAAASPGSAAELGKHACLMFNDQAARKFAQQHGAPDCAQALGRITVPDPDSYREVSLKGLPETPNQATSTTIDSCSFPVNGGPKLGTFTLSVVHENKWLITDVTPSHCG